MPTWGQILKELNDTEAPKGTGPDYDGVRRKYLLRLHELTGRGVILYTTSFLESRPTAPADIQIGPADIQGFMEAVSDVAERELDLVLHSPGGSAKSAESLVTYLRKRFDHIRVFVPIAAMSAATMMALSANEIVMGQHSQLGPIDPQFIVATPEGPRSAPAKAILNQFELAKRDCKDASNLPAWMPILRSYLPGLLTQCEDSQRLAVTMVSTHNRGIDAQQAADIGVKVIPLEEDGELQDAVLSVHHAAMHTFSARPAAKIIENHHGRAWVKLSVASIAITPASATPPDAPRPSRAERRRNERGR